MIANRLLRTAQRESPGSGMFGWTAIHVHVNMVERQLQSTPDIDRVSNWPSSRMEMDGRWFLGKFCCGSKLVGRAKVFQGREKKERYNRARKIILSMPKVTKPSTAKFIFSAVMAWEFLSPVKSRLGNGFSLISLLKRSSASSWFKLVQASYSVVYWEKLKRICLTRTE